MKNPFFLVLFLYGLMAQIPKNFCMQKVEKDGMTVYWKLKSDRLEMEVFAPTQGWVGIGWGDSEKLAGHQLILGQVDQTGQAKVSERFIVAPGDHRSVASLGGKPHLITHQITETTRGTTLRFSIQALAKDTWHHDLKNGEAISLLIAYAREDDFSHHSHLRTSVPIKW